MLTRAPTAVVRDWHSDSRHWDRYEPREGDIVIGTAAKVGTTWTSQIVNLLVFQSPEPRTIGLVSPWLDARIFAPLDMMLADLGAQTHRRFIKTHLRMDAVPIYDEVKYLHTARDGRDAAMSYMNHLNSHTEGAWARFDEIGAADPALGGPMPRAPGTPREFFHYWLDAPGEHTASGFIELERSYWAQRKAPNVLLVHYNDLKADLDGEMRRISSFLDIPINEDIWPSLVEAATFDAMKRDGDVVLAGYEFGFEGGHRSFLHKATNGRWQGVVDNDDLARWREKLESALSPKLIAWLEGGRAVAGDPRDAID